jgi:CRISPR-associated exonuclease Cas4
MQHNSPTPHYTGTQINYYLICQRKLWLFSHNIQMEQESDAVRLGKVIHETSYDRENKEIELDHIKLDWLDMRDGVIHEVKKDDACEEAHEWQMLYYLYYLKTKGMAIQEIPNQESDDTSTAGTVWKGELDYPKLKKCVEVILTTDKETRLLQILRDIERVITLPQPPPIAVKISLCKKCSYCDFCHA